MKAQLAQPQAPSNSRAEVAEVGIESFHHVGNGMHTDDACYELESNVR